MKKLKNKWVYIVAGLAVIGIGIFIFKRIKGKSGSIDKKPNFKEGNNLDKQGSIIISTPVTKASQYPLVYVFGGIDYANPDWMLKQIPQYILSRSIVVLIPYTTKLDSVNVKDFLTNKGLKIDDKKISITGFSAGGINVQDKYNSTYRVVGLIDPSTRESFLNLPFSKNTKMLYNDANWTGYPNIRATLPKLDKTINEKGGEAVKVNIGHSAIPKAFFEKYKTDLV